MALAGDDGGCATAEIVLHYCGDEACADCDEADRASCMEFAQHDPNGCEGYIEGKEFGFDDAGVAAAARCDAIYSAAAADPAKASACGLDAGSFDDAFDHVATVLCGP